MGIFDYELIDENEVILYKDDQESKILKGKKARQFLQQIEGLHETRIEQLIAKLTGGGVKAGNGNRRRRSSNDDYDY